MPRNHARERIRPVLANVSLSRARQRVDSMHLLGEMHVPSPIASGLRSEAHMSDCGASGSMAHVATTMPSVAGTSNAGSSRLKSRHKCGISARTASTTSPASTVGPRR
jgi:hypothetical protein